MVEQAPDGRLRPVVMDFGIAREGTQNSGLTEAGMVMGTPNYMAPEQAAGAIEQIDRRSDVYSLGATLYELLTDRPPFVGDGLVDVLFKVVHQEPTPPRQLVRSLPIDLETITLKCLAKESSLRYDSAKALAEDLTRYIDGEPIFARKASLSYRLGKQLRKHKSFFALALASLIFIGALVVDRVRSSLAHARQARIVKERIERARLLGQDAKEIEWFMRAVYELPLHDITYEQDLIRSRMDQIEAQIPSLGKEGGQLAHYAIGRGYLTLHETDNAHQHLRAAWESGPQHSPELHFALGRVLGDRFFESVRFERRRGDREWLRNRRKQLAAELLLPAMGHLEASRGVKLESADYLEGLLALYHGDHSKALHHADQALRLAPWLYEAKKLKGDAMQEQALERFLDGASEKAESGLRSAIAHYNEAATVGRSDIAVYEARSEAWAQLIAQRYERGLSIRELLPKAQSDCQATIQIAPQHVLGYRQLAQLYLIESQQLLDAGQDPRPVIKELVSTVTHGLTVRAADPMLENALGDGLLLGVFYESSRGLPPSTNIAEIIAHQERAITGDPANVWAYNDIAGAYLFRANLKQESGQDPRDDFRSAIRYNEQAIAHSPSYVIVYSNLAFVYGRIASYELEHKLPVEESLRLGMRYGEECKRRKPTLSDCHANLALLELVRVRALQSDPQQAAAFEQAVERTLAHLVNAEQHGDKSIELQQSRSRAYLSLAEHQVERGEPPKEALAQAKASILACRALDGGDPQCEQMYETLTQLQKDYKKAAPTSSANKTP